MKTKNFICTLSLGMIILSGCSKNDGWYTEPDYSPMYYYPVLNSNEKKLQGKWNLQSISTTDSLYVDSSFIRGRSLVFKNTSFSDKGRPEYTDFETGLSLKKIPNKRSGITTIGDYNSPDTSHLKIITIVTLTNTGTTADNSTARDSSLLRIMTLTSTQLSLRDTVSNFQWNFVR